MVICLEWDAVLHMAQLMPLPLTVSCFSKIQIGFTFLVPAHPGSPGKRAVKRVCVMFVDKVHGCVVGGTEVVVKSFWSVSQWSESDWKSSPAACSGLSLLLFSLQSTADNVSICEPSTLRVLNNYVLYKSTHLLTYIHTYTHLTVLFPAAQPTASKHWRQYLLTYMGQLGVEARKELEG